MSLATTCPTCQTVFRVVEDQLKVSEGWVRCGQCQQVFNALEGLFDLSAPRTTRSAPLTWAPTEPVGFEHDPAPNVPPRADGSVEVAPTTNSGEPGLAGSPTGDSSADAPPRSSTAASREFFANETTHEPPEGVLPAGARFIDADATQASAERDDPAFDWAAITRTGAPPAQRSEQLEGGEDDSQNSRWAGLEETPPAAQPESATPAFVRDAERRERWQRPQVRLALFAAASLLSLSLLGQVLFHWRDRIAASRPVLRPLIESACRLAGCELQPPRVLEALVVDSTTVTRLGSLDAFRLSVQLRNRADYPVAAPHLELNLTDAQGRPILRRVLKPADFRVQEHSLAPQTEALWSLDFSSGQRRITGYTVAAFYP